MEENWKNRRSKLGGRVGYSHTLSMECEYGIRVYNSSIEFDGLSLHMNSNMYGTYRMIQMN
jgi:hypothetical protein